jgi:hypothetical protein
MPVTPYIKNANAPIQPAGGASEARQLEQGALHRAEVALPQSERRILPGDVRARAVTALAEALAAIDAAGAFAAVEVATTLARADGCAVRMLGAE